MTVLIKVLDNIDKTMALKIFLLCFDIFVLSVIFFLFARRENAKRREGVSLGYVNISIAVFLILLFIPYALYADMKYIEPNWIQIEKIYIRSEKFPAGLERLKIVQISDLHMREAGFRERSLIKKVNRLKPDIIVITGDFLGGEKYLANMLSTISKLRAKKGIYAILGDDCMDALGGEALEDMGVPVLEDESIRIPLNDKKGIWIIGLRRGSNNQDVERAAYAGVNFSDITVLLMHNPDFINSLGYVSRENTDLVLAGDTHGGGQIGLAFIRKMSPSIYKHNKYISGLYNLRGVPLYVNRGIGVINKDFRFFCRPEITLITFKR
jgi:uncharacterized protein